MGRRLEIELTSTQEDTWTWRAAGAKKPKGDLASSLLYPDAKVGDVVKVEAEFHLDGIEVTQVFPPKQKKGRTDLLEMKSRPLREDEFVTTQLAKKSKRNDKKKGRNKKRDSRPSQNSRPKQERRPKPVRLKPKRVHRDALIAETAPEYRPIIEQVIKDGLPGVRAAIKKQNAEAKAAGKPEIDSAPIIAIAEKNLTKARQAEWRDRADDAASKIDTVDLRDLRSVVVTGADNAKTDEAKEILQTLKSTLDQRVESDHTQWLSDIQKALGDNRVVAALRLSSRPVRAGAPLPAELATALAKQTLDSLKPETSHNRWSTVLDALAFSPVRSAVKPTEIPAEPSEELIAAVRRLSDRIPEIAKTFGIDPADVPKSEKRRKSFRKKSKPKKKAPAAAKKSEDKKTVKPGKEKETKKQEKKPAAEKPAPEKPQKEKEEKQEIPAAEEPKEVAKQEESTADKAEPEKLEAPASS